MAAVSKMNSLRQVTVLTYLFYCTSHTQGKTHRQCTASCRFWWHRETSNCRRDCSESPWDSLPFCAFAKQGDDDRQNSLHNRHVANRHCNRSSHFSDVTWRCHISALTGR